MSLYLKAVLYAVPVLIVLAVGGYIWYLKEQLNGTLKEVSDLRTEVTNVRESIDNLQTRLGIEDTVRRTPDPAGVLRDRYSRPTE
jgi:cell division protein FtsL